MTHNVNVNGNGYYERRGESNLQSALVTALGQKFPSDLLIQSTTRHNIIAENLSNFVL